MLCIPKKEGTLHTIIDQWEQNTNTIKDITPMPDQDNITTVLHTPITR
jgi:hypothetical protein